jgi:carboxypeptidase Taq
VVYRRPWAWTLSVSHCRSGPNSPVRTFDSRPSISLGSVLAAQLYAAAAREIDGLESNVRTGEFGPLRQWLTDNVHRHGRRYTTDDLVREATGESFAADHFLEYVEDKFGALYDIAD